VKRNIFCQYTKQLLGGCLIFFVQSCGTSSIVIEGQYPSPNVTKIPLSIGVIYPQELIDFNYVEYSEIGEEEYRVQSGQSHRDLFDALLPSMFEKVVVLDSIESAVSQEVDIVFLPAIEEFQLALPSKTKLDVFEVWVKYNLRISDSEGEGIADWILTSYGKTPTRTMRSVENSINQAAVVALRDFASSFTLGFSQVPEIRQWLSQR
jgi:hypothetical protein|tara:strand:+ start:9719 stop:10339 length:621 start_codon:yes stop_codon:yes gene_type:complete